MTNTILQTKLNIPFRHPDLVPRSRLCQKIENGIQRGYRLTLVSAPAGFGKSSLLADWADFSEVKTAWLSLGNGEDDLTAFWNYAVAAIRKVLPGFAENILAGLQASPPIPVKNILPDLINELSMNTETLALVLDDYHLISQKEIHESLAFVLNNQPNQFHLVLSSRTDPPLALARLRARSILTELRADDLRFTQEEAETFLNQIKNLQLSVGDIENINQRSEGWITGLQLSSLSMQGREDKDSFIKDFSGSNRYILDYLFEEVLSKQTRELQDFLLKTSILEQFCADLCKELTGEPDSQVILEQMERQNLFVIPLDTKRKWFRYHHLFADILKKHLSLTQTEIIPELHKKASSWFEKQGEIYLAIRHALASADHNKVASLLDLPGTKLMEEYGLKTLLNWLDLLPDELVRSRINLCMAYAWSYLATSRGAEVENYLEQVEKLLGFRVNEAEKVLSQTTSTRYLAAEILIIRANAAFSQSKLELILLHSQTAQQYIQSLNQKNISEEYSILMGLNSFNIALAHEFMGNLNKAAEQFAISIEHNYKVNNLNLLPIAISHLSKVYQDQGKLIQAVETYKQAIQTQSLNISPLSSIAHTGLGHAYYEFNQLEKAEQSFRKGLELALQWNYWESVTSSYFGLSKIACTKQDWEKSQTLLEELDALLPELEAPWGKTVLAAHQALSDIQQNNVQKLISWLEKTDLNSESEVFYLRATEFGILARVYISLGKTQDAENLLQRFCKTAEQNGWMGYLIECLILQASACQLKKENKNAMQHLKKALDLAEPRGYLRVFLDEGAPMLQMLGSLLQQNFKPEYIGKILSAAAIKETKSSHNNSEMNLIEALTSREEEVLEQIANGASNQEIALALSIALGTVKNHLKNIYAKLNVNSRTQALSRARELGLLK